MSGRHVNPSFDGIRCEFVADEVVARGPWAGAVRDVSVIAGVDPAVLLAVDIPGGECADGDVVLSGYSMVIVGRHDPSRAAEADLRGFSRRAPRTQRLLAFDRGPAVRAQASAVFSTMSDRRQRRALTRHAVGDARRAR